MVKIFHHVSENGIYGRLVRCFQDEAQTVFSAKLVYDRRNGTVKLKRMSDGEEKTVPAEEACGAVRELIQS